MPPKRQPKAAAAPEPEPDVAPAFVSTGYQPYNEMPPPPPARNEHWVVMTAPYNRIVHYFTSPDAAHAFAQSLAAKETYGFREEYTVVPLGLPD